MHTDFHILFINDSHADVQAIRRTLLEAGVRHRLTVIDHFRGLPDSADDKPDLILIDLNLAGIDGIQILTELKSDASLKSIPVVVLTTPRSKENVLATDPTGTCSYIPKPVEFRRIRDLIITLRACRIETASPTPRE